MTIEYMDQKQWTHFDFYSSGGANGSFQDSLAPAKVFKVADIRLHMSVLHASIEYFTARISSTRGSAHNVVLISQLMSTVTDVFYQPSSPMIFCSDDHLVFSLFIKSATNTYGLNVRGWSVNG